MSTERCETRLWQDFDGLRCNRPADHPGAHRYAASEAPDRHDLTEPSGHREG